MPMTTTCRGRRIGCSERTAPLPVAQLGVILHEVLGRQIEFDVDRPVLEPAPVNQPDIPEDSLHADVVRQRLGDQPSKAGLAGNSGKILEQHGGDAFLMMIVGDGKGHLGLLTTRPGVVLADGDQLAACLGDERDVVADVLLD